jgi:uncharacterized membrane protein YkgB
LTAASDRKSAKEYETKESFHMGGTSGEQLVAPVLRYGLVAILLYLGTFKFTGEEAKAIEPLVANSPLFSWLHAVLGTQGISNLIDVVEIVIAALIAARPHP